MALFNEILEGRYGLLLSKLLSMKGADSGAPQLSGDVVPALILESDPPEWAALAGTRLCCGHNQAAAGGAGNRTQIGLLNPANSGIIARLELILAGSTAAVFGFPVRSNPTIGASGANVGVRDTRIQQTPACTVNQKNNTAAAGTTRMVFFPEASAAGGYWGKLRCDWVIHPGQGIIIDPGNDNQDMQAAFVWRERAANNAELSLGA